MKRTIWFFLQALSFALVLAFSCSAAQHEMNLTLLVAENSSAAPADICSNSIFFNISKAVFNSSERIEFRNQLKSKAGDFSIEYWIEDSAGKIVRSKKTTNNLLAKSATLSADYTKTFVFKNHLIIKGCPDSEKYYGEKEITVVGKKGDSPPEEETDEGAEDEEDEEEDDESGSQEDEVDALVLRSFYTRAKNPAEKIKVYAGIAGYGSAVIVIRSPATLINESVSVNKSQTFSYEVLLQGGENSITAELYQENRDVQSRLLLFNGTGVKDNKSSTSSLPADPPSPYSENNSSGQEIPEGKNSAEKSTAQPARPASSSGSGLLTGSVVFESDSRRQNKIIVYLLLATFGIAAAFLAMNRLNA